MPGRESGEAGVAPDVVEAKRPGVGDESVQDSTATGKIAERASSLAVEPRLTNRASSWRPSSSTPTAA